MIAYLASPIDFVSAGDDTHKTADLLADILVDLGKSVYRANRAWAGGVAGPAHSAQEIAKVNRMALDAAGVVVAYLPRGVQSVGVPMEIAWAVDRGTPAVVITEHTGSLMLNSHPLIITVDRIDMLGWALNQALDRARNWSDRLAAAPPPEDAQVASLGGAGEEPPTGPMRLPFRADNPAQLGRAYAGDAGLDMFTVEDAVIQPGHYTFIPCGVSVELPADVFGWVVARSSTMRTWGLVITPGIVDSGYRGELGVEAYRIPSFAREVERLTEAQFLISAGTRLAQLVLLPNLTRAFEPHQVAQVRELTGERGANGFGSSGLDAAS